LSGLEPFSSKNTSRDANGGVIGGGVAAGVDLRDFALRDAWLPGANLSGSNFEGVDLSGANLAGADLAGANLRGADLRDADLRGAQLENADLSGAVLDRAMMVGASMTGACFDGARLWAVDCSLVSGETVSFCNAELDGACFESAILPGSSWKGAVGRDVVLRSAQLVDASFADVQWVRPNFRLAQLERARFDGAGLPRARFERADCKGSGFVGTTLAGARLRGADFDGADFQDVIAPGLRLRGLSLSAEQAEAFRVGGAVGGAVAAVEAEVLPPAESDAQETPPSAMRRGWSTLSAFGDRMATVLARVTLEEVVPGADLSGRDYAGHSFAGRDLRGVCLDGARLVGVDFSRCDLQDARLTQADLTGALFVGADLTGAVLVGARMEGVQLSETQLANANLQAADLTRADLSKARAENANFRDVRLLGATLDAACLDGACFEAADLRGASVKGSSFKGAEVMQLRLGGVVGFGRDPVGALREQGAVGVDEISPELNARLARVGQRLLLAWLVAVRGLSWCLAQFRVLGVAASAAFRGLQGVWARRRAPFLPTETRGPIPSHDKRRRYPLGAEDLNEQSLVGPWSISFLAAGVIIGLLLFGDLPDQVSDAHLEQEASDAIDHGEALVAASRYAVLAARAETDAFRATWLLEQARVLIAARERSGDPNGLQAHRDWRPPIEVLEEALPLAETSDVVHRIRLRLAATYVGADRHDEARELLNAILGDPSAGPEMWSNAVLTSVATGLTADLAGAVEDLASGRMANNPDSLVAVLTLIGAHAVADGRQAEVLAALDALDVRGWTTSDRAKLKLVSARAYEALGQREAALQAFDAALALLPSEGSVSVESRYEIARLRTSLGALDAATVALAPLLVQDIAPEWSTRAQLLAARIARLQGEFQDAERLYREVLDRWSPDSEWAVIARRGLGQVASAQGQMDALLARLDGSVLDEGAPDVIVGAASARLEAERPMDALKLLDALLGQLPEGMPVRIAARSLQAQAYVDAQMLPEAIEALRGLQAESEGEARLAYDVRIAEALYATGRLDEAAGAFTSILEVADGQIAFGATLGLARIAEAREHTEQALVLYSEVAGAADAGMYRASAFEGMAGIHLEEGRLTEALVKYRDFVAELPDGHWARLGAARSMAEILVTQGEFATARPVLLEALAMQPGAAEAAALRALLAQSLLGSGKAEEADKVWESLASDPLTPASLAEDIRIGQVATATALEQNVRVLELTEDLEWTEGAEGIRILLEYRVHALEAAGRTDEAQRVSSTLEAEQVALLEDVERQLNEMRAHMASGRHEQAADLLEQLRLDVVDTPTLAEIDRERAKISALAGDRLAARKLLEASLTQYASVEEAVFLAGLALAAMDSEDGNPNAALRRLLTLKPPDDGHRAWWFDAQARAHWAGGDEAAAAAAWQALLDAALGPEGESAAHVGLGELALASERFDDAVKAFERAHESVADSASSAFARLRLAQAHSAGGRHAVAVVILRELLEGTLELELRTQVELTLASELQDLGEWEASAAQALSVDVTGLDPAYSIQSTQIAAAAYVVLEDFDGALALFETLSSRYPSDDEVQFTSTFGRANVASQTGRIDEAVALFEALFQRVDASRLKAEVLLGWARALENADRDAGAQVLYRRIDAEYGEEQEIVDAARAALNQDDD